MAITIKELANQLNKLVKQGKGDYKIFLTDDEECNGYHGCWYLGQCADEMDEKNREYSEENNRDLSILGKNKHKAFYLG